MATYTIRVHNQSGASKSYVVFMQPPQTAPGGSPVPVYTNAWATFDDITDGAWDSVNYTPPPQPAAVTDAGDGSFPIEGSPDFTPANNFVFGLSRPGQTPPPAPVEMARSSATEAPATFYVANEAYTPGQVSDPDVGPAPAAIDFAGRPETTAVVTQGSDGGLIVTYA